MKAARLRFFAAAAMLVCASAPAEAELRSATGGDVHALIVGIDAYINVVPQLQGSVGDAKDIAAILRGEGVADIRLLTDLAATRTGFVAEMQRLIDVSKPGDLAIITYSGHGGTVPAYPQFRGLEPNGRTEEFIMVDYAPTGLGSGAVITNKEMKAWLARLDGKGVDVLFVADSCFGGGMVRGIPDPRVGTPLLRVAKNIAPEGSSSFKPIAMTQVELHTDVATLTHVTVLSGADRFTPVPEVFIPTPPTRRGALSYAVARALKGNAVKQGSDLTTRRQLFAYARQEVQHYSDNQRIDNSPRASADDPALLDRPVFRRRDATAAAPVAPQAKVSAIEAPCPVQLAAIHDAAKAASAIKDAGVTLSVVADPSKSDLVWDVAAGQVIQNAGDVIANGIGPVQIRDVIRRASAIACIKALTEIRPQRLTLRDGVRRYTPKDNPMFEAEDVSGRFLIIFDLAADGRVQMVWPQKDRHLPVVQAAWTGSPDVVAPFGADYVVAVSSSLELRDFRDWLEAQDNRLPSAAEQVPAWLRRIQAQDPTSRIGAVTLYTGAK